MTRIAERMLSRHFSTAGGVARYRRSPAGQFLDGFAQFLARKKYARSTATDYVKAACHLGNWLGRQGSAIEALDEVVLASFERHLPRCQCPPPRGAPRSVALAGARQFLRHLRDIGAVPRPALAEFVDSPFAISRYRIGPLGLHMDGFARFLRQRGYAYETTMMYLGSARHLSHWMAARRMPLERMDENTVRAFDRHLSHCRCPRCRRGRRSSAQHGVRRLLDYLRAEGLVAQRPAAPAPPALLVEFSAWMKAHRGVGESTLRNYGRYLHRFLRFAGEEPARFVPRVLRKFILGAQAARKTTFGALRMFIRFLVATGRCPSGLEEAIPRLAEWRLASLPRYLPSTDVERVIASAPFGSRERAVVLLLARLGLRRGDVVALSLQDIDWKKGLVRVVGKSGREAHLPLPQDVGNALLAYLKRRPACESDRVFLAAQAPVQPVSPDVVSGIVYWAIRRAGIRAPSRGCHLLRHSAATRWLREGLSMEHIGVLLRHRHVATTEIYAKVDVTGLRKIAQPWPRSSR